MNIEIIGVTASHVDDLIYIGTNEFSKLVIDVLMQVFKVSKHEVENFVFTGWTLNPIFVVWKKIRFLWR